MLLATRARASHGGRSAAFALGNMLSAGVMVGAGLCHLLAAALEDMPAVSFPLAPFLAGVGFLLTLVADAVSGSGGGGHSHGGHPHPHGELAARRAVRAPRARSPGALPAGAPGDAEDAALLGAAGAPRPRAAFDVEAAPAAPGAPHVAFVTAVLMAVAMGFHALLEGTAMGAQGTIAGGVQIFVAIVSHKGLSAYALGSSVVESGADARKFWSVILPFALASPVGIFVGYAVSGVAGGLGAACVSAVSAGTFLYVAFMEVIPKELQSGSKVPAKLGALLVGYGAMSLLAIWA